tara:strand:- start:1284 stop:1871 length:588 start_codon:yes stop_codon:yes gene_type:complete
MSKFWNNSGLEPKRGYKFQMSISGVDGQSNIPAYIVKTAKKPTFTMSGPAEVKYIQHTFKYPGRVTWDPVDVTILDPMTPDSARILMNMLAISGYAQPADPQAALTSISKAKAGLAVGGVKLAEINSDGAQVSEWMLWNPYFSGVDFGSLGYDSDDLIEYTLTIQYDYATYRVSNPEQAGGQVLPAVRHSSQGRG